ncbi:hypothetical protein BpHYR1_010847 [Brachionus plicatilis]|uniref:Uncharacterized protein n=1 Tax=Brachionus plicatilis TaxID=10195 RepID=A0A3M7RWA2_BRAPC|nr:hypothetical protein BpHYR1_010847 [Brachionus plicatilis]
MTIRRTIIQNWLKGYLLSCEQFQIKYQEEREPILKEKISSKKENLISINFRDSDHYWKLWVLVKKKSTNFNQCEQILNETTPMSH